ncbi:MAG: hypothetical protein LBI10_11740 [Deltaproteobacteria bacterium]|jgi:hypothetical protein|nr:hypothetical protein [Deltaproteobacteria bacterium]
MDDRTLRPGSYNYNDSQGGAESYEFSFKGVKERIVDSLSSLLPMILWLTIIGEAGHFIGDVTDIVFLSLVGGLFALATHGAVSLAVVKNYHNETLTLGQSLNQSLTRLPSLILIFIFVSAAMMGLVIPGVIVAGIGGVLSKAVLDQATLGLALGIIVGIVCLSWGIATFSLSISACVTENLGALDSLKRSRFLTAGHRLKLTIIYFVWGTIVSGISLLAFYAVFQSTSSIPGVGYFESLSKADFLQRLARVEGTLLFAFVFGIVGFISQFLINIMNSSIYLELLITKNDQMIADMSQVFE